MKIKKAAVIFVPPEKGRFPHLGQNRWFHYSSSRASKIHPLLPSMAATLLKEKGYEVLFLDGINRGFSFLDFMEKFSAFAPDAVIMETKTPLIRDHWDFIRKAKQGRDLRFILAGDHVSFFPEESLENSPVDYCIKGGDYDIAVLNLLEALNGRGKMPPGVWHKKDGKVVNTGEPFLAEDLDSLPFIDRELTGWRIYGEAYLHRPCAYILSGRGCGGKDGIRGACKFCSWQHALWNCTARLRSPANVAGEIEFLKRKYKVREVFDDNESGGIYDKSWLKDFCGELEKYKLPGKVYISSNARADTLDSATCALLKKSGFRLLKVGLESANDDTLKRIGKQESFEAIEAGVRRAKDYGLRVMLTMMIGYPWEGEEAVRNSYEAARKLLLYKPRLGDALQVSLVVPYPGTPLYRQALENGWFAVDCRDYRNYDMSVPVLKTSVDTGRWGRKIWSLYRSPRFLSGSFRSMRSFDDLLLVLRGVSSLYRHISEWR